MAALERVQNKFAWQICHKITTILEKGEQEGNWANKNQTIDKNSFEQTEEITYRQGLHKQIHSQWKNYFLTLCNSKIMVRLLILTNLKQCLKQTTDSGFITSNSYNVLNEMCRNTFQLFIYTNTEKTTATLSNPDVLTQSDCEIRSHTSRDEGLRQREIVILHIFTSVCRR